MALSIEDIAARIEQSCRRGTWPDVGHELFAETIEFLHEPPIPAFDGPWAKDALLYNLEQKNRAWRRAIPDREFAELELTIDEDTVTATYEVAGTYPPGHRLAVRSRMQFVVADGKISGIVAWVDQSQVPALIDALLDGGYIREDERSSTAVPRADVSGDDSSSGLIARLPNAGPTLSGRVRRST